MQAALKEQRTKLVGEYRRHPGDSGSADVQVALVTARIRYLTGHMKTHQKDHATRRGLLGLVARRTRLLRYLRSTDPDRYRTLIQRLGLRR